MAYEQRNMSGSLFKNDKREKDTHPNMRGSCLIDGVEYWVDAWTKDGQKGRWQSLSFRRKDAKQEEPARDTRTHAQRKRPSGGFDDMPDDIPF